MQNIVGFLANEAINRLKGLPYHRPLSPSEVSVVVLGVVSDQSPRFERIVDDWNQVAWAVQEIVYQSTFSKNIPISLPKISGSQYVNN